jgi:xanthine dehydrogenase accessory factor
VDAKLMTIIPEPCFDQTGPISASLRAPSVGSFPTGKPDWEPFDQTGPISASLRAPSVGSFPTGKPDWEPHAQDSDQTDEASDEQATEGQPWQPAFALPTGYSDVEILRTLTGEVNAGRSVALVTVTATARSVPRHAGAKLLVLSDGESPRTLGTIGGGEMEARCILEATVAMADGKSRTLTYELLDAANGDPGVCGGTVELFVEPFLPTPTVYVIGCGHVGAAVVNLAKWMGFRVVATDDRAALATQANLPGADAVFAGPFAMALEAEPIGAHTSVVVVTRNMAVDLELLPMVLATTARFVGVMGSARRWATTVTALQERGVSSEALARVHSPIGLNINAETPEEIAVSIMAAVVSDRRSPRPDPGNPERS